MCVITRVIERAQNVVVCVCVCVRTRVIERAQNVVVNVCVCVCVCCLLGSLKGLRM